METVRWLNADDVVDYLRDQGLADRREAIEARELPGGVSNVVYLVRREDGRELVVKQARERLRVPEPWYCAVARILREVDVLNACAALVQGRCAADAALALRVPEVYFVDRSNYLFVMSAVPAPHRVWKGELLQGEADPEIAAACGELLGTLHAASWKDSELALRLEDQGVFVALRLEPFYASVAAGCPEMALEFRDLSESVLRHRLCLVHADFTPKNILLRDAELYLVDFETGHFGDPAFDVGLFLAHLVLKAVSHFPQHEPFLELTAQFWRRYHSRITLAAGGQLDALVRRSIRNFAGCAWARLAGKSRIDYLKKDRQRLVIDLARAWIAERDATWEDVLSDLRARLDFLSGGGRAF